MMKIPFDITIVTVRLTTSSVTDSVTILAVRWRANPQHLRSQHPPMFMLSHTFLTVSEQFWSSFGAVGFCNLVCCCVARSDLRLLNPLEPLPYNQWNIP